jgi:hypothetical protein
MSVQTASLETKERIHQLVDDLPPASLTVVERFVAFVYNQARQGEPVVTATDGDLAPYRYPTVSLPASALGKLIDLMPPVGGDALADTEALYDET